MLENCCYGYNETLVLRMVRGGEFGDLTLRRSEPTFTTSAMHALLKRQVKDCGAASEHTRIADGNLYPTHGLGPVAHYMDVNRGDRFDYAGLHELALRADCEQYRKDKLKPDDPRQKEALHATGDLNASA